MATAFLCLACKGTPLLTLHVHGAMHVVCGVSPQVFEQLAKGLVLKLRSGRGNQGISQFVF